MHPILFKIGGFEVRTYGVILLIAFLVGMYILKKRGEREGIAKKDIYDLTFYTIIAVIVGSRLFYVLYHLDYFKSHLLESIAVWEGGLVFYGGVLFALATIVTFIKIRKLSLFKLLDWIGIATSIGITIGRWGCFFNGCCFGVPTKMPWGVVFPPNCEAGFIFPGRKIHPTQLYESFGELLVFLYLLQLEKRKPFDGYIFWIFVILAATVRYIDDFFRYYEPSVYILNGLTINQLISLILILIAGTALFIMTKKRR